MKRRDKVVLELSGMMTDREKLWQAIRHLRSFTTLELAVASKVDRASSKPKDYIVSLVRAGIVRCEPQICPGTFARYELVRDTGVDAPRVRKDGSLLPDSGQSRMWAAMKVLRVFSVRELAVNASLPEAPVLESTARAYCKWLVRGRYLVILAGQAKGDVTRYRFARDTGARAPQVLGVKQLYDPNVDKVVAGEPVSEAYERADDSGMRSAL